jgi:hypothetical protein
MALHPALLKDTERLRLRRLHLPGSKQRSNPAVANAAGEFRQLYGKIVRLRYNRANGSLSNPVDLITGLPAGNDHVLGTAEDRSG